MVAENLVTFHAPEKTARPPIAVANERYA